MKNPCPHIDDPIDKTLCENCIALRRQSGRTREQLAEARKNFDIFIFDSFVPKGKVS